jgi:ABC-type proline/glycine betaine transport system permease subunit
MRPTIEMAQNSTEPEVESGISALQLLEHIALVLLAVGLSITIGVICYLRARSRRQLAQTKTVLPDTDGKETPVTP